MVNISTRKMLLARNAHNASQEPSTWMPAIKMGVGHAGVPVFLQLVYPAGISEDR